MYNVLEFIGVLCLCFITFIVSFELLMDIIRAQKDKRREATRVALKISVIESHVVNTNLITPIDLLLNKSYYKGTLKDNKGSTYKADPHYIVLTLPDGTTLYNYDKSCIKMFQKILDKHYKDRIKARDVATQIRRDTASENFRKYINSLD